MSRLKTPKDLGLVFCYEGEFLHQAAHDDNIEWLEGLLQNDYNGTVHSTDEMGRTPLHIAASSGSKNCLEMLLKRGAKPNVCSGFEDQCFTPLHHAVAEGNLECVKILLKYETSLDLRNSCGQRPLELAKVIGPTASECANYIRKVMAQRLMEIEQAKGEDLYDMVVEGNFNGAKEILENMKDPLSLINGYYRGPNTLLYRATFQGHKDIVQLLIDYKADGRPNSESALTPLYAACYHGHYDIAVILAHYFPKHLTMPVTINQTYPLHAAVMKGKIKIIEFLLALRDQRGRSREDSIEGEFERTYPPLHRSHSRSTLNCSNMQYYVDINQPIDNGYTPLHIAVMYKQRESVKLLLKCQPIISESEEKSSPGCLVIDKLCNMKTPFHLALIVDAVEIAELLIQNGADKDCKFDDVDDMCTPLQYVCNHQKKDAIAMLLRNKVQDMKGAALRQAAKDEKNDIVYILLQDGIVNWGIYDDECEIVLAANELELNLKPIYLHWNERFLDFVSEQWFVDVACRSVTQSQIDISLSLKLFTFINLSKNLLSSVPMVLFQMPSLKVLNLSENKISELPIPKATQEDPFLVDESNTGVTGTENWNCPSLSKLFLNHNELETVPESVFQMPALQDLDIKNNSITALPFNMWLSKTLDVLDASHNKLKSLPMFTSDGNKKKGKEPGKKKKQKCKSESEITKDQIDARSRKSIFARTSTLYSKRPTWEDNTDSEEEDGDEPISTHTFTKLDLSHNDFSTFPVCLPCLAPDLSGLNMSHNKITEISSVSMFPRNISYIDLSDNRLKCLHFSSSEVLECNSPTKHQPQNRVSYPNINITKFCQHRRHRSLIRLVSLKLENNLLEHVSFKTATSDVFCEGLKNLNLSKNKLTLLPKDIGKLSHLGTLSITENPKMTSIPSELGLCSRLFSLNLDPALLYAAQLPKNVIENYEKGSGNYSLLGYLKSLHDKAQPFPNIKLMLVGKHYIGKTTLLDCLRKEGTGTYQQPEHRQHYIERVNEKSMKGKPANLSTVGVNVCDWEYEINKKVVKFSTWDFAGQKEYYATHQCFLSKRAIYLLLWNMADGDDAIADLESWLLNIQMRAANSSVIIVGTHADKIEKRHFDDIVKRKQLLIKERFVSTEYGGGVRTPSLKGLPKVVAVISVSCVTKYNINDLRNLVHYTAIHLKGEGKDRSICLLDKAIPASYIAVDKAISVVSSSLQNEIPVLDSKTFRSKIHEQLKAMKAELKNENQELDQAVEFLHGYGSLLHFDDPSLNDLYFVNPQWLCDLLAHIVTVKSVNPCIKNGLLKISDLQNQIFHGENRFPASMIQKYVELLNRFEVAIKISNIFLLIPSLLPEKQVECPIMNEQESTEIRKAMDIQAYLQKRVFRRQYLMSYIPSGFWSRLLTRMIADDRFCKMVSSCCEIQGSTDPESALQDAQRLMNTAPPEWACWKTGLELSCFGTKLLRVCQLPLSASFYGADERAPPVFVKNPNTEVPDKLTLEIIAPCLKLNVEKFIRYRSFEEGCSNNDDELLEFRVTGINYSSSMIACQLFVNAIDHIDNLLAEWFPKLDQQVDGQGIKSVRRVSFCPTCIQHTIKGKKRTNRLSFHSGASGSYVFQGDMTPDLEELLEEECAVEAEEDEVYEPPVDLSDVELKTLGEYRMLAKDSTVAFELEEGTKLLRSGKAIYCPFHYKVNFEEVFPDLCFVDLDPKYVLHPERIKQGDYLAQGGFGKVYKSQLLLDERGVVDAAMKVSLSEKSCPDMDEVISYDAYRNIRQEVAILIPLRHRNIVEFLGVSFNPLAMFLQLAPGGSLNDHLKVYREASKKVSSFVITEALRQISSALRYLHRHDIIYRDLKCENVLVWDFPSPVADSDDYTHKGAPVALQLTDYGISRAVSIGGNKGYWGTHGYIAPEILRYMGKECYSSKVDCFSFGCVIYEMLALNRPFYDISKTEIIKQYIMEGKRPRLTYRERRYPVLLLSLLYKCWGHNPDDRPTASEINSLTSLSEFPALMDVRGLGESFDFQCVVTSNQSQSNEHVIDSRNVIGSHLWFCGSHGETMHREGFVTVCYYNENKYNHVINIKVKEKVTVACSVGSTIWLGTEGGAIMVYCSLTYKLLAKGACQSRGYILKVLHCPVFNLVLFTMSDGIVLSFHDTLSTYEFIQPSTNSDNNPPHPITRIKHLTSNRNLAFESAIHCVAVAANRCSAQPSKDSGYCTPPETVESSFELWCGQEKGLVTILDVNTLRKKESFPAKGNNMFDPMLEDLIVTFLETSRSFDVITPNAPSNCLSNYIWSVVFPGTYVERRSIESRQVEGMFDASQHSPQHNLNSPKNTRYAKPLPGDDAQIQSLVIVEEIMYVGTSFGCMIFCDALTMIPYSVIRCYKLLVEAIIPFRMFSNKSSNNRERKIVLSCGRKCLDNWKQNFEKSVSKEMTILTWRSVYSPLS